MDRLVEYYNEYKKKSNLKEYYEWFSDVEIPEQMDSLTFLKGFCKWLVDNDKIKHNMYARLGAETRQLCENVGIYNCTLMLLSIQDNPIEFLISILK